MGTSAISGSSAPQVTTQAGGTTGTGSSPQLAGTDFLSLLVTQLAYQDPLSPMDNSQFTQQLVSMASLEQLTTIAQNSTTPAGGSGSTGSSNSLLDASRLVGMDASVPVTGVTVTGGKAGSVNLNLSSAAASVTVDLLRADGSVARSVKLGPTNAGDNNVALDSATSASIADGSYALRITATDSSGDPVNASASMHGTVTAVTQNNGQIYVDVNGSQVLLDDVTKISSTAPAAAAG